jgi:hypothetical protein
MATRKTKTIEEKLRATLEDTTIVSADGSERKALDVFRLSDFTLSPDSADVYIKHAALLRAAKKLFGGVRRRTAIIAQPASAKNGWMSVVAVEYEFNIGDNSIIWSGTADCHPKSAPAGFKNYPTAMAETRASARALRELLGVEMCSQEEIVDSDCTIEVDDETPITDVQATIIEKKILKQHGFKEIGDVVGRDNIKGVKELKRWEAQKIIDYFNRST